MQAYTTSMTQWFKFIRGKKIRCVKEHVGAPCVVLVINENLYGLMCALSYTCRICPLASLGACVGFKVDKMQGRYVVQAQYARSMMRNQERRSILRRSSSSTSRSSGMPKAKV